MGKLASRAVLSLVIGAALVFLAFRDLAFGDLKAAFQQADYFWLWPYLATMVGVQVFRAWRWRYLLEPIAPRMPSMWRILTVSWVGFMAIIALPLRLGEVVRPYLIADPADSGGSASGSAGAESRLRMSAALGTIAVERVVDGLIVSIFLFVTFFVAHRSGSSPSWVMPTAWTALAVFGGALVFLACALAWPERAVRLAMTISLLGPLSRRFPGRLTRVSERAAYVLEGIIQGFRTLGRPSLLVKYVVVSLVYWALNGLGFYLLAFAFHLDLPLTGGYAICGLVAIGITLPSGPALVGNFHEFARLGLELYFPASVVQAGGMAYVVMVHGLQLAWYVGVGFLVLVSGQVSFKRLVRATREPVADPKTPSPKDGTDKGGS